MPSASSRSSSKQRRDAVAIFRAALKAADPVEAVERHLRLEGDWLKVGKLRYDLARFERIWVIGAGKASGAMAYAVERTLGKRVAGGWVNVKYGHLAKTKRVRLHECGHPVPDQAGVEGAARIAGIARAAGERDLVICVFSGGGSALMPAPAAPVKLEEKQATTRLLLACGANIHEINAVRKHISALKGGQLARLCAPAAVIALMLSDVIGDDLDVIASGPTAPDSSTFAQALGILKKYGILERVPEAVRTRLCSAGEETPKPGDPVFDRVQNVIVGSNRLAVDAAGRKAKELGYGTVILSTLIQGETREIARMHAAIALEAAASGNPAKPPACIISGGETTVTLKGDGLGGRNQEFVLAAAIDIAGAKNITVLSGGTDGTDGPTDAAGAIADGATLSRAPEAQAFLDRNDSYHYFERLGDLLKIGPTNTNVMDVRVLLVG